MTEQTLARRTRIIACIIAVLLAGYIVIANTTPFDVHKTYRLSDGSILPLGPKFRVEAVEENGISATKQIDDLVYFSTKFPFKFDSAAVKVMFQNQNTNQALLLGFSDRTEWHYDNVILDTPLFHAPGWQTAGAGPMLYQRFGEYASIEDFFARLPQNRVIGTLDFTLPEQEELHLPGYAPTTTETIIDTPFRGRHTLYAYLENEPFVMAIEKQDLNWYEGPDAMTITVSKNDQIVLTATIEDDGIEDDSKTAGNAQNVFLQNPGPELPETGVYKIDLDVPGDAFIRSIATNLHKLAFSGPLYPMNNAEVYPAVIGETATTTLYTSGRKLRFETHHNSTIQDIGINDGIVPLAVSHEPMTVDAYQEISKVVLPKSDVIIGGSGYFAFAPGQLFAPKRFEVKPVTSATDLELADYVISSHVPPQALGDGYSVVERTFELTTAVPKNGSLSWMLSAPGIKEKGGSVGYTEIEVTYTKKGWWGRGD